MTDETENLILEHLKRFQGGQERIERDLRDVKSLLSQVEIGVAHLAGDVARLQVAFDGMSERIDRIERRLELA